MVSKRKGKRERAARKRHFRARYWSTALPSTVGWLKLGRKHFRRMCHLEVADSETRGDQPRSPTGSEVSALLSFCKRHEAAVSKEGTAATSFKEVSG